MLKLGFLGLLSQINHSRKQNEAVWQRHTLDGTTFVGGAGVGSFSTTRFLRLEAWVDFLAGTVTGLELDASGCGQEAGPAVGSCGTTEEGTDCPPPPPTASGRKSLNSANKSWSFLNKV